MSDCDLLKPEFDSSGGLGVRRWYVAGYNRFWFTSKDDAQAAIDLARAVSTNELRSLGLKIEKLLP